MDDIKIHTEPSASAEATADKSAQETQEQEGGVDTQEETPEIPADTGGSLESGEPSGSALFFDYVLKGAIGLAAFLTPLWYFFSSDVISISKSLLLTTLALIVLAAWVGKIITLGKVQYRRTWLVWGAVAVGVVAFISTFASSSFWVSFLGDSGRAAFSTTTILAYVILFIAALQNLTKQDTIWVIMATATSAVIASVVSLLQLFGVYILPGSFTQQQLFNPLGSIFALALFAAFSVPILVELFQRAKRLPVRILLGVLVLLQLFVVLVVNFSTAWLALAIAMLIYLGFISYKQGFFSTDWRRQKRMTIPLVILVIAVLLWALPGVPGPRIDGIPAEISPSYGASIEVVQTAWGDNPLLGAGPEGFPYVYSQIKDASLNQTNFWGVNFNNANAEILTWFATLGILGSIAWLVFVGWFLWVSFRAIRETDTSTSFGSAQDESLGTGDVYFEIGILTAWLFILASKFFYQTPLSLEVFFWLLPAVFLVRMSSASNALTQKEYEFKAGSVMTLVAFVASVVLLIVSIGGLYLTAQRWVAESSYAQVFTNDRTPETRDQLIQSVNQAINLNPREARYYRSFGQVLLAKVNDIAATVNERAQTAQQQLQQGAITQQAAQQQAAPTEEETQQIQNLTVQAVTALQRARQLDPQNVGLLVDVAESYRVMDNYVGGALDTAINTYKAAVELEPINPFLRTQLAQLYLAQENFFTNRAVRTSETITAAQEQLERAVELNPNYSNARYFLGFVLDRQNNRQAALEQFSRVLQLNPDNEVVAQIVQNLQNGFPALGQGTDVETPETGEDAQGLPGPDIQQ